jgi:hypothetical protein
MPVECSNLVSILGERGSIKAGMYLQHAEERIRRERSDI